MASKFAENFLHGYEVGHNKRVSEEEAEQRAEDRKFQRAQLKLQSDRLKIKDMEEARGKAFDEAEVFAKVSQEPGEAHIPAGGYGQPAAAVPYQGLKATLAQQIHQKQQERMRTVTPDTSKQTGLPPGEYDADILREAGDTTRSKATRESIEGEGRLNRGAQIQAARIRADASNKAATEFDDDEIESWGEKLNSGEATLSQVPAGKEGKHRSAVMLHMQKSGKGIMTPDIRTKLDQFLPAQAAVDKIEETFNRIQNGKGIGEKAGGTMQLNAEVASLSRLVGRAIGEKGVFTDEDKKDFANLLQPGGGGFTTGVMANFAPEVGRDRLKQIRAMMDRVRERELKGFEERTGGRTLPGSTKKKRKYDAKTDSFVDME